MKRIVWSATIIILCFVEPASAETIQSGAVSGPCNASGTCAVTLTAPSWVGASAGYRVDGVDVLMSGRENGASTSTLRFKPVPDSVGTNWGIMLEDKQFRDQLFFHWTEDAGVGIEFTEYAGAANAASINLESGATDADDNFILLTDAAKGMILRTSDPAARVSIESELGIAIGSTAAPGTTIKSSYRSTTTTDIAALAANSCNADIPITVTGAVGGAECIVGMPATTPALLQGTCFVSAADTVQLRICNGTNAASADPASATYSVRVFNP